VIDGNFEYVKMHDKKPEQRQGVARHVVLNM